MTTTTRPAPPEVVSAGIARPMPVRDSLTMVRRNLKHIWRYPSMTIMLVGQPLLFLLLFVYVFGDTLGNGLPGRDGGRHTYLTYVTPAVLVMAVASIALGTAVSVAVDMTGRDLVSGTPHAHDIALALGWSAIIAAAGYAWARWLYGSRSAG